MKTKTKRPTFVDLACAVGVAADTPAGRAAYLAWMRRDPQAARKAATDAIRPRRAESSSRARASKPRRSTRPRAANPAREDSTAYPASWRRNLAAAGRPSGVRAPTREAGRPRITQAGD